MKKLLFIYNPNSGTEKLKNNLADIIDIFVKNGYEVTAYPTQAARDATQKVLYYKENYDLVVASGGDGTLDEVVEGMMHRRDRVPIGYIPAGTTNDFASSLHIPRTMTEAAQTAVSGEPFYCDIGKLNGVHFAYVAAFGLFTNVSYETKQNLKNTLGYVAYILEGAKQIFNIPSYRLRVTCADAVIEDEFMYGMVTNSRSVGGIKGITGRDVAFDDGKFEVTLIKMPKNPTERGELLTAVAGRKLDTADLIYTFKASDVHFTSKEEITWTLDGEYGGSFTEVNVEIEEKALAVMVGSEER